MFCLNFCHFSQVNVRSVSELWMQLQKLCVHLSAVAEHMTVISIVAGSIGVLGVTFLSVSATKAVMAYYERLRLR